MYLVLKQFFYYHNIMSIEGTYKTYNTSYIFILSIHFKNTSYYIMPIHSARLNRIMRV